MTHTFCIGIFGTISQESNTGADMAELLLKELARPLDKQLLFSEKPTNVVEVALVPVVLVVEAEEVLVDADPLVVEDLEGGCHR